MEGKGKLAKSLFEQGYNCAQSVVAAFAQEMGMDTKTAARLVCGLGGGVVAGGQGLHHHVDGVLGGGGHVDHFVVELLELGVKGFSHGVTPSVIWGAAGMYAGPTSHEDFDRRAAIYGGRQLSGPYPNRPVI